MYYLHHFIFMHVRLQSAISAIGHFSYYFQYIEVVATVYVPFGL